MSKIVNEVVETIGNKVEGWQGSLNKVKLSWKNKGVLKEKEALIKFLDDLLRKTTLSMPKELDFYSSKEKYLEKFIKIFRGKLKYSFGQEATYLKTLLNKLPQKEQIKLVQSFGDTCSTCYTRIEGAILDRNFPDMFLTQRVVDMENLEVKYGLNLSKPTEGGALARAKSWFKNIFAKSGQPPKGTAVVEKGVSPPKGGTYLGLLGIGINAALFVLEYPGIGHAARISDNIYYELKPTLLSKYHGDEHTFAKAFEFYIRKNIFSDKFREKYSLLDFPNEYTALARAGEKHNLSDSQLQYVSKIYLGIKKNSETVKFSVEELINARKWYDKLDDKEFKQKYNFESLLIRYNKSKTNFHNSEYIEKFGLDLERGGGELVLREVLKRMYDHITLNEFKRPVFKTKKD